MRWFTHLACVTAVTLSGTTPLSAAEADVEMPSGVARPDKPMGAPKGWAWVASEGFRPRKSIDKDEPSGAAPLRFMEMCSCAAEHQKGDVVYLLLAKGSVAAKTFRLLGWVDARHTVRGPDAKINPGTKIYYKAMIVNTVESIGEKKSVSEAPVLLAPNAEAKRAESFRLFNIYFVYGDSNEDQERDGYLLLGTSPAFNYDKAFVDPEEPRRVVLGWVPKDRICPWNTREALEWDTSTTLPGARPRRTSVGQVYASIEDAKNARRKQPVKQKSFEEVFDKDGVSRELPHDRMRFPIVPHVDEQGRPIRDDKGGLVKDLRLGGNRLLRVGVVGGFVNAEGVATADFEKGEKLRRKLEAIRSQARVTELLFVIDDTASMKDWFREAAATIEQVIDSVRREPSRKVRIAIAYYNDTTGADLDQAVAASPLVDADSEEGKRYAQQLRDHQAKDGGDPRERAFHGLKKGIETAKFQPDSRKIVILLGDMADKSDENDPAHAAEKAVVAKLLPPGQEPIEFYALQVVEPESHPDARAYRTQMRTILALYREELKKLGEDAAGRGSYFTAVKAEQVREKILARYADLQKKAVEYEALIGALSRGQWNSTRITPEQENLLKRRGIDPEELKKLGVQLFGFGYVWENNAEGARQVRERLLVTDGELERFIDSLKRLQSTDPGRRISVKDLITKEVNAQLGEPSEGEKPGGRSYETVLKAQGLTARSPLLRRALEEIKDDLQTQRELQLVFKKKLMLEAARENKEYEFRERTVINNDVPITVWDKLGGKPKQRKFYISGDESVGWYWINFTEEWP